MWVCVSMSKTESVYLCVYLWSVVHSPLPSAPHTPFPPLGRTACLAASPPACNSPLTNPTNRRPLQQSHMRVSSYQKILHYTHACILVHRLLRILDICLPYSRWYNVHNPVCSDHRDIQVIHITKSNTASLCLYFSIQYEYFFIFFAEYCYSIWKKGEINKNVCYTRKKVQHFPLLWGFLRILL